MRKLAITTTISLLLGACAGFGPPPLPGQTMAEVEASRGQPGARYPGPDGSTIAEYGAGAFGQFTYMATYGADGRLRSYEQVLTDEKFATVRLGQDNKDSILRTFGRPADTMYLSLRGLEVWSYRYKQSGVWNAMMHIHFSQDGIVREMQSGPDPLYEEKRGFF
jgi:hypothetical protein